MKKFKMFGVIAVFAITFFLLAGCEETLPDGRPILVVDITVGEAAFSMNRGSSEILTATARPSNASVGNLLWELYDADSAEKLSLSIVPNESNLIPGGDFPIVSGNSVMVTGLRGGEAKVIVTAIGSGAEPVSTVINMTVNDVSWQLEQLRRREDLPARYVIPTVISNETLGPQVLYFDGEEIEIVITSETEGDSLTLLEAGNLFTIGQGVTLTLNGVTLYGVSDNDEGALVVVLGGGSFVMNQGSGVKNNINTVPFEPTVLLNLQGGGIRVETGGALLLNGGEISGNSGHFGGGVFNLGSFTMRNGGIINNRANRGSGVYVRPHAVFVMENGTISENEGFTAVGDTPSDFTGPPLGGGVLNEGVFTMLNGSISANIAREGGGVFNTPNSVFNMHGAATEISGNVAGDGGGGLANFFGTFNMHGGVIRGNTASFGGGIDNPGGTVRISSGTIFGHPNFAGADGNLAGTNAALFNDGGTTQHGTFSGTTFIPGQSPLVGSQIISTGFTISVTDGQLMSPSLTLTITGLTDYVDYAVRLWVESTPGNWTALGAPRLIPASGVVLFNVHSVIREWDFEMRIYNHSGDVIVEPAIETYAFTKNLTTGHNVITYAEISASGRSSSMGAFESVGHSELVLPESENVDVSAFRRALQQQAQLQQ